MSDALPEGIEQVDAPPGKLLDAWTAMRARRIDLFEHLIEPGNYGKASTPEDYITAVLTEWQAWGVVIDDENFQEQFDCLRSDLQATFNLGMFETQGALGAVVTGLWMDGIALGLALAHSR